MCFDIWWNDDGVDFWSPQGPIYYTLINDNLDRKESVDSLKIITSNNASITILHIWNDTLKSACNYISIWFKGTNENQTWGLSLEDDSGNWTEVNFVDNGGTGWRHLHFAQSDFAGGYGTLNWARIVKVTISGGVYATGRTIGLDFLTTDDGSSSFPTHNLTGSRNDASRGVMAPAMTNAEEDGTYVECDAYPNIGFIFDHWLIDGSTQVTDNPYYFYMSATDHTIEAIFEPIIQYNIDAQVASRKTIQDYLDTRIVKPQKLQNLIDSRIAKIQEVQNLIDIMLAPSVIKIICDDDWNEFFTGLGGDTFSDNTDPAYIMHGSNSYKIEGTNPLAFYHSYDEGEIDLTGYRYIHFWFYGEGDMNDQWHISFYDYTYTNCTLYWTDNIVGWKLITLDTENYPDVDWGNIQFIEITNSSPESIFYFDYMYADNESDTQISYVLDIKTILRILRQYAVDIDFIKTIKEFYYFDTIILKKILNPYGIDMTIYNRNEVLGGLDCIIQKGPLCQRCKIRTAYYHIQNADFTKFEWMCLYCYLIETKNATYIPCP